MGLARLGYISTRHSKIGTCINKWVNCLRKERGGRKKGREKKRKKGGKGKKKNKNKIKVLFGKLT